LPDKAAATAAMRNHLSAGGAVAGLPFVRNACWKISGGCLAMESLGDARTAVTTMGSATNNRLI